MMRDLTRYEEYYREHPFEDVQARFRKKCVIENLMRYPHRNIVEVGCGLDSIVNHFTGFENCFIIEPAKFFFEQALTDIQMSALLAGKVKLVQLPAENVEGLPFIPDVIIASGLLHEVLQPELILKHLHQFCADHTMIHINVPNANSVHRLLAKAMGLIGDVHEISASQVNLQQHRTFDMQSMTALVNQCGYEVVSNGTYFIKSFTHQQMQQLLDINFLNEKLLDGFYSLAEYFPENGSELFVNIRKSKK